MPCLTDASTWVKSGVIAFLLLLTASASAGRSDPYGLGTPMARIDIRDARPADFSSPRQLAKAVLEGRARGQNSNWSYYEGATLLRNCIEKTHSLAPHCGDSFHLELLALDFTVGEECVMAQGLRSNKDMDSLLRRFFREAPEEARSAGELVAAAAFLRYADPERCPESPEAATARAGRAKLLAGASDGDAEEQYQLALRTSGGESARWLCLAANRGHAAAQYEYGKYFEVQRSDAVSAYHWYLLSDRGGYWQAAAALKRVEQILSPSELETVKSSMASRQTESCVQ